MSIKTRVATDSDLDQWDGYVERPPQGTLFHERSALETQATHADAKLHHLVGLKGQEFVGTFPVFELKKGLVTAVFSLPPYLRILHLRPAFLNMGKLSQRKQERRRQRFLQNCFEQIESELAPKHEHVWTAPGFSDARPFKRRDYDADLEYTYFVDLSRDEEALLQSFSSDASKNITNAQVDGFTVAAGGESAARDVLKQVSERFESQGISSNLTDDFVVNLTDRAEHGAVQPYSLAVDGEFVRGILAVEQADALLRWQDRVWTDIEVNLPVNDLLDWEVMRDGRGRGLSAYDLVGADTQCISSYKPKFAPILEPYYSTERGKWGLQNLTHTYQSIK